MGANRRGWPPLARDGVCYCRPEPTFVKIRHVVRALEADGWRQVAQKGSHRHFKHPVKPGKVTVAGRSGVDLPPKTLASIRRQSQIEDLGL